MAITEASLELAGPADVAVLYEQHGPRLVLLCQRLLGPGGDAEDAAHEALLKAWRALDRFDPNRPIWPWLATIARHTCIDQQRRRATTRTHAPLATPEPCGPEDLALGGRHAPLVRDALRDLPAPAREVLFLRDVEGWDYERIGQRQGRTARAVRMAVSRARQDLRTSVEHVARARGQWPLSGLTGGLVARLRPRAARLRSAMGGTATRAGIRLDTALDGLASAIPVALAHAAIGAVVLHGAASTLPAHPAHPTRALDGSPVAAASPTTASGPSAPPPAPGAPAPQGPAGTPVVAPVTPPSVPAAPVELPDPAVTLTPTAPASVTPEAPELGLPLTEVDPPPVDGGLLP
jgi:RNA polymerase sigma-70 factor (ECF subfamily)